MKARRVLVFVSTAALVAACGSRTGLLVPSTREAGADATEEPATDATDATEEPDAIADAASEPDAVEEDVFVPPDGPDLCPDAGSTLIYVISSQNVLMAFNPPTATFTTIGTLRCPDPDPTSQPFSMAVDRLGTAYVVFSPSGNLFRVSTKTAACAPTAYVPQTGAFNVFGMGYSANVEDGGDGGETLYIAGDPGFGAGMPGPSVLASLDTTTFQINPVGSFSPPITGPELTGTGSGQLYGFYAPNDSVPPSFIDAIDKTTARIQSSTILPGVTPGGGWAFGFWGGDFYTFTAPGGLGTPSVVTRYRPSDGTIVQVGGTPVTIVGAGVSTCAPQM